MMDKSIGVVLLIENIDKYIEQFKLLVISIRKYNNLPIYAITPTKNILTSHDIHWCDKNNVVYHCDTSSHDICKGEPYRIHSDIIKAQTCLISTNVVKEDYILHIDNDTLCQGNIINSLRKYESLINILNVGESYDDYIDSSLNSYNKNFIYETQRNISLLGEKTIIDKYWPASWFIFHPRISSFWSDWVNYILQKTNIIMNKKILFRFSINVFDILETVQENFLFKSFNDGIFSAANRDICQLSLFDKNDNVINNKPSLFYNYGGFDQNIYRLLYHDYVNEYLNENLINYNTKYKSVKEIDPGNYHLRV